MDEIEKISVDWPRLLKGEVVKKGLFKKAEIVVIEKKNGETVMVPQILFENKSDKRELKEFVQRNYREIKVEHLCE